MNVFLTGVYYYRKYQQFEKRLDDISDYILFLFDDFERPMFKFGSYKHKSMMFRNIFIKNLNISNIQLSLSKDCNIKPFENIDKTYPIDIQQEDYWYPKYSRYKHNSQALINVWTLKDCFYSLGCAFILTSFCTQKIYDAYDLSLGGLSHYFLTNPSNFLYGEKGIIFLAGQYEPPEKKT